MQDEVMMNEKEKKPLSKKGKILRILAIVLAVLLLLGGAWWGGRAALVHFGSGEFYGEGTYERNTHITLENVSVENNILHYTIVNKTRFSLHDIKEKGYTTYLSLLTDQGSVPIYPTPSELGNKGHSVRKWDHEPVCFAFDTSEGKLYLEQELQPGQYLFERRYYACTNQGENYYRAVRVTVEFEIPAAP